MWVNFSFPVVVVVGAGASPPLLTVGGFNDSLNGSTSTVLAEYVGGSGTSQLLFEYTVRSFFLAQPVNRPYLSSGKRGLSDLFSG